MKKLQISIISVSLCILIGCASQGLKTSAGSNAKDWYSTFINGDGRLTCQLACSGSYGGNKRILKAYYDAQVWLDLSREVSEIGYAYDQAYFYLGRSAEGLGFNAAARTYYALALAYPMKCNSRANCDDLDISSEIKIRLNILDSLSVHPKKYK